MPASQCWSSIASLREKNTKRKLRGRHGSRSDSISRFDVCIPGRTLGGLLAWRLKLPLILGFVVGGVVISPFTPGPQLSDLHTFEVFAEVGVVLLMFSIGVEFSIPDLMQVKWVAIGGGTLGILMSIGLALHRFLARGWSMTAGHRCRCHDFRRKHDGDGTPSYRSRRPRHHLWPSDDRHHARRRSRGRFHDRRPSRLQRPLRRPPSKNRLDARQSISVTGASCISRTDGSAKTSSSRARAPRIRRSSCWSPLRFVLLAQHLRKHSVFPSR